VNTIRPEAANGPLDVKGMRAAAEDLLGEDTLPRWDDLQEKAVLLRGHLMVLVPAVEDLAAQQPKDDVPAHVARIGLDEARRRMDEIEGIGLASEFKRVQRLARSVRALCDHYETLTGLRMCSRCDKPFADGEASVPYDLFRTSSSGGRASEVHAACMPARTRD
jgi:hypothetical protein